MMSKLNVYVAISAYGDCCCFGVRSAAEAWAGEHGTVDEVELREPPQLVAVSQSSGQERGEAVAHVSIGREVVHIIPIQRDSKLSPLRDNQKLYAAPAGCDERIAELERDNQGLAKAFVEHCERIADLEAQLAAETALHDLTCGVVTDLEGQLTESREQIACRDNELVMRDKALDESREREGRMREALHKLLSCGRGTSGRLIIERDEEQAAWAALAAEKE